MSKRTYFRTAFGNQRVNEFQTLLKSVWHYYYPIFLWIWNKLSCRKSVLVRCEILGLFVNRLTAKYKYSRRNMQNFPKQLQMPLSLKQKAFARFSSAFLKSAENLERLWKKGESPSLSISEIIDLTSSKHCLNLHGSTIILFFDECGINWVGKCLT